MLTVAFSSMPNVAMLSVGSHSVVAPPLGHAMDKRSSLFHVKRQRRMKKKFCNTATSPWSLKSSGTTNCKVCTNRHCRNRPAASASASLLRFVRASASGLVDHFRFIRGQCYKKIYGRKIRLFYNKLERLFLANFSSLV